MSYLSFLCARLLDLRNETRAARVIQGAWRNYRIKKDLQLYKVGHTRVVKRILLENVQCLASKYMVATRASCFCHTGEKRGCCENSGGREAFSPEMRSQESKRGVRDHTVRLERLCYSQKAADGKRSRAPDRSESSGHNRPGSLKLSMLLLE